MLREPGDGIQIESGRRVGACGTCKVKLLSGEVFTETEDGLEDEDRDQNMILCCVAVPKTDVILEAGTFFTEFPGRDCPFPYPDFPSLYPDQEEI